jgi:hypothetical protein
MRIAALLLLSRKPVNEPIVVHGLFVIPRRGWPSA